MVKTKLTKAQLAMVCPAANSSYQEIEKALRKAKPKKYPKHLKLKLDDLLVAEPGVFQHRLFTRQNIFESQENTLTLAKALKERGVPLEPLLVFPVEDRFYVMDGHHRLAAYQTVSWKKQIPVEVFEGSFEEAHREALKRNSRNKLSMTKREKSEAAWRLVKEGIHSKSEIADASTVGSRTVGNMRVVWKELQSWAQSEKEKAKANNDEDEMLELEEISWLQALQWKAGRKPQLELDDWKEREAQKIIDALEKHNITAMLIKDPEITAIALENLLPNLTGRLAELWEGDDDNDEYEVEAVVNDFAV
jgi:hypothetical protein